MSRNVTRRAADWSPEEKRALLARRLRGRVRASGRGPDSCLHHAFEAQAARTPEAVALEFEDRTLSYRELNAWANRIAHRLRALGVGPEALVGLCVERSAEMVAGLLGILKAGGAYVPIDASQPPERLAFILDDARTSVVLTQRSLATHFEGRDGHLILLDEDDCPRRDDDPEHVASPDNLAYVIYTSGSTGKPKGVPVSHANVARLFRRTQHWFRFGPADAWTLFHSFAFDFSVWEIWGALLYGGRLVVVPYWVSRSPGAFRDLLRDRRVTVLNQTPSAFRQLIRAEEEADAPADDLSLRLVIFGGEALDPRGLAPWFERHGDRSPQLVNMYGITETTVHVTYRPMSMADLADPTASSPIGRPIPDLKVYVLDRNMEPVPVGVAGEMYIGGAGLARGYLNRPGLTAERFVPDPFGGRPGARLYRTGDLARRRPDGALEYLGRCDFQVKVRGFRIELGEIEAALGQHPDVREAVVLAREDVPGDQRLVAYVVPPPRREAPSTAALRAFLKGKLPDYMIPSAFVALGSLPLTGNGKTDRDALPAPSLARSEGAFVEPRTPTERRLAEIWAEVLGAGRVGTADNFFELGGHSLLATQVMARVARAFRVEVPLRAMFEAPTVAGLADRIEAIRGQEGRAPSVPAIRPTPRDGSAIPLSSSQRALWFLDRLAPGEPTFNVAVAVRVRGPLDPDALGRAFAEIARRHEALRTSFALVDGEPVQVIAPEPSAALEVADLRALPESDREAEAERLAIAEARRPFDLARGPLARAVLVRIGDEDHAVLLTMHHIVSDGWSFGVAAQELATLYEAFRRGEPSPLPALTTQYADFALWQRVWLRGEVLDGLLAYWTRQLAGVAPLELPTDRPRPAVRSSRGAVLHFELPEALTAALGALALREGATPFMVLLAAFQALLHRYSGQDDIAVGSPIANRNRAEVEGLVGYFVNMLVLRADLSGDPSFRDLLARVREVALGAFEHQDLPFDRLVEALQPPRDLSRTPLFQAMFVLQNNRMPDVGRRDLELSALRVGGETATAKFDLTLALEEVGGGLVGSFEYSTDLFVAGTIERMAGHFRTLLEGVVARPEARLSALPMLTEAERGPLVGDLARGPDVEIGSACLPSRFEAQAARTPDAVALVFEGGRWSYRELNERANRLAHHLIRRGVGPDVPVAITVERSPEMAVGLLGVLKAGGAFVPLDPSYPRERLALMLEDVGAPVLLTQHRLRERLPETRAEVICLDADWEAIARESDENPGTTLTPDHTAYVIFTSGTTGTPRGAAVPHRGLANHNVAAASLFGLGPDDRVLQFSSISFDILIEELFPSWISGAAVVLRSGDDLLDPARFTRWIDRERITVLDLPTAYWHAWVDGLSRSGEPLPDALRLVIVGGEKASASALASWRKMAGDRVRWLNTYGPTEATVIATAHEPPLDAIDEADPPLGRPIANTQIYLLDAQGRPVPMGLPGELFIGGAGVARGYWNRPGLTAERFVPDPFGGRPGARLFRTGDLARWRPDGALEFLGRVDQQVKVRGFRVEPGEVEAALGRHPSVREAAVVANRDEVGENRLDAYVVVGDGPEVTPAALRRFLRERLPRHMVPATITRLDALPLTVSGKVDRPALPRPEGGTGAIASPPRDEVESRLVRIWEEVLGTGPVGVADNFFDLGGHSLLAIRLTSRVEDEFGRRLPLSSLFLGATVEELAALLREPVVEGPWSPLVAVQASGDGRPFFCVHPAGGIVYCFHELARALGTDRSFLAFQSAGLDDDREPSASLEEMAASYIDAMRAEQPEGPYHLGGWSLGGVVAFEMARQLRDEGHEVATLALFDTRVPRGRSALEASPEFARRLRDLASEVATLGMFDAPGPGSDPLDDAAVLAEFAGDMATAFGGDVKHLFRHLRGLSPEERRAYVLEFFQLDQVYHLETGPERVQRLWKVLRANFLAQSRYTPRPYSGRLVLFRADGESGRDTTDPTLGWDRLAGGGVTVYDVPGDHATILKAPGVRVLAEALRSELDGRGEGAR
jgi:amino acid adenylation domain-containing protein